MSKAEKKNDEIALSTATMVLVGSNKFSLDDLAADAGAGSQNVTQKDLAVPLLSILQDNSPQVKKIDAKYIPGATAGMVYNNVTGEIVDGETGIMVVPCFFNKVYIEWKQNRGGLVGIHNADSAIKDQAKPTEIKQPDGSVKLVQQLPNGNILVETNQHYVLVLKADGSFEPAVIPMVSSNMKASKTWNTLIKKVMLTDSKGNAFNPASFYCQYKLTSKGRQKDQNSWYVWGVEQGGPVPSKTIYDAAKALEKSIAANQMNVKYDEDVAVSDKDEAL